MQNILVPVDGSESALRAVEAAIQAARLLQGAQLHIVTVQPPILSGNVSRYISAQELEQYYQEEGQKALESARQALDAAQLPYTATVLVGPTAQTLADYASQHQCNHIIMGTRGLGSVRGLVLGSVATKVLSLVDVPVTLVR